jgi:hypothetical protein
MVFLLKLLGALFAGKCKVEETEKGWYITLIHRDPMQVSFTGL